MKDFLSLPPYAHPSFQSYSSPSSFFTPHSPVVNKSDYVNYTCLFSLRPLLPVSEMMLLLLLFFIFYFLFIHLICFSLFIYFF